MILLSGKKLADKVKDQVKVEIKKLELKPKLAVVLIGNDPASEKYVSIKERACKDAGIDFELLRFKSNISETDVIKNIKKLNKNQNITGIIVQLPLPKNLVPNNVLEYIDPKKDVDGLTSYNLGKLIKGLPTISPATPEGTIRLLKEYGIPLVSKKVTMIGQSNLVGKPLAQMLLNEHATVFVANSMTKDLKEITLESDIVISAVGRPNLITADMIKENAVVIDIGTMVINDKIFGDVDFENVSKKVAAITPNPGGVGPMTVAILIANILKALKLNKE